MNRYAVLILLLAGSFVCRDAASADTPIPHEPATYLVIYSPGPAWLPGKAVDEQPLRAHGSYLLDLYIQGVLKFAGPFTDDGGGGALVLEAADQEAAQAFLAADPAVISGVMVPELRPLRLADWEQHAQRRAERQAAENGD